VLVYQQLQLAGKFHLLRRIWQNGFGGTVWQLLGLQRAQ
jgi:hypothetical protein